jgi:hypothetical protein
VDNVVLGQVFLRVVWFFPVNNIPPLLHINSYIIWGIGKGPDSSQIHSLTPSQQLQWCG